MARMEFEVHNVIWDKAKVNRFWDYFVKNQSLLNLSFSKEVGQDIVRKTKKYINGKVLDYGCGGGTLMQYLLDRGISCDGIDASPDSITIAKKNIGNNPLCGTLAVSTGIPNINIPDNTYSMVYFIETIEHILPDELDKHLAELYRIVTPGGYVFISTPHREDLQKYNVLCPDCGAVFHRVQHQGSFDVNRMTSLTSRAGFKTVICKGTYLMKPTFSNFVRKIIRFTTKNTEQPHLIYIGRK